MLPAPRPLKPKSDGTLATVPTKTPDNIKIAPDRNIKPGIQICSDDLRTKNTDSKQPILHVSAMSKSIINV